MKHSTCIILMGPQHVGKSTVGTLLSKHCNIPFIDSDEIIMAAHSPHIDSIRELYRAKGKEEFQRLEAEACCSIHAPCVFAAGGGLASNTQALMHISPYHPKILLSSTSHIVWKRIIADGIPSYISSKNIHDMTDKEIHTAQQTFHQIFAERMAVYQQIADIVIDTRDKNPELIATEIHTLIHTSISDV